MMAFFIGIGLLFFLLSFLFFFAPGLLVKMSEIGNKMVFTDYNSLAHRKISGTILLVMSVVMFYLAVKY